MIFCAVYCWLALVTQNASAQSACEELLQPAKSRISLKWLGAHYSNYDADITERYEATRYEIRTIQGYDRSLQLTIERKADSPAHESQTATLHYAGTYWSNSLIALESGISDPGPERFQFYERRYEGRISVKDGKTYKIIFSKVFENREPRMIRSRQLEMDTEYYPERLDIGAFIEFRVDEYESQWLRGHGL